MGKLLAYINSTQSSNIMRLPNGYTKYLMINMLMIINFTIWEFNMAMENPPFIDVFSHSHLHVQAIFQLAMLD